MEPNKPSYLFTLGKSDVAKGLITAIFAAILTVLYGLTSQTGFNVFEAHWGDIFNQVVNVSVTTFMAYLFKNFISDRNGVVLGDGQK